MGMTLARKSLDEGSGSAHRIYLETDLGSNPSGAYTISVADEGDILAPGVDYKLFADSIDSAASNRCSSVADLTAGQAVQGDTSTGTISALHGSCIDTAVDEPDKIHAFTLQKQRHVELELTSTGGKDLGLSLRRDCLSRNDCAGESLPGPDAVFQVSVPSDQTLTASADPGLHRDDPAVYITSSCGSAVQQGDSCLTGADLTGDATKESAYLPAADHGGGTFFVVVDSEDPRADGEWQVSIQTTKATCPPGQTRCGNTGILEYCGPKGLGYQTFQCQGTNTSCVTQNGRTRCKEPSAEVCADAKVLTVESGNNCVPGARRCNRSGHLEVCNPAGPAIAEQINCPNGCHGGRCKPPSAAPNTCGGAVSVNDGMYIHDSWSRYKDTYDPSGGKPGVRLRRQGSRGGLRGDPRPGGADDRRAGLPRHQPLALPLPAVGLLEPLRQLRDRRLRVPISDRHDPPPQRHRRPADLLPGRRLGEPSGDRTVPARCRRRAPGVRPVVLHDDLHRDEHLRVVYERRPTDHGKMLLRV
jgi:hypothetical protein